MNKTVVTGASGFVGAALLRALLGRATPLRALVRRSSLLIEHPRIEQQPGDLTDTKSLPALVQGAEVVFHLAGYAHASSRAYADELERHRQINLQGSLNLAAAAASAGVRRFVFVSSVKAIGEHRGDCLDERHTQPPQDPYGQIKRETEERLFEQAARAGMEVVVLRPALVYGAGVKGNLAAMLRAIERGRFPPVPETHNVRSMVSVDDLVQALLLATEAPAAGQALVITDGEAYSTRRLYTSMATALGRAIPGWTLPASALRALGYVGDLGEALLRRPLPFNSTLAARLLESACYRSVLAESRLGFKSRQRLEDVLPAMVAAYRNDN